MPGGLFLPVSQWLHPCHPSCFYYADREQSPRTYKVCNLRAGKALQRTPGDLLLLLPMRLLEPGEVTPLTTGREPEPGVVGTQMPGSSHCVDCDMTRTAEQEDPLRCQLGNRGELPSQDTAVLRLLPGKSVPPHRTLKLGTLTFLSKVLADVAVKL